MEHIPPAFPVPAPEITDINPPFRTVKLKHKLQSWPAILVEMNKIETNPTPSEHKTIIGKGREIATAIPDSAFG
jgi:hypothetical protein